MNEILEKIKTEVINLSEGRLAEDSSTDSVLFDKREAYTTYMNNKIVEKLLKDKSVPKRIILFMPQFYAIVLIALVGIAFVGLFIIGELTSRIIANPEIAVIVNSLVVVGIMACALPYIVKHVGKVVLNRQTKKKYQEIFTESYKDKFNETVLNSIHDYEPKFNNDLEPYSQLRIGLISYYYNEDNRKGDESLAKLLLAYGAKIHKIFIKNDDYTLLKVASAMLSMHVSSQETVTYCTTKFN